MNKKIILSIFILFSLILVSCDVSTIQNMNKSEIKGIADKVVGCEPPYIRKGINCCLDANNDAICDSDETSSGDDSNSTASRTALLMKLSNDYVENKTVNDSDGDGIPDDIEVKGTLGYVTDPHKADTDGDGLNDLREYWWLCDPTNPDTNGDFISDGDSVNKREAYPYSVNDDTGVVYLGILDVDGDGIPTPAEIYDLKLNPKQYSSDGDRYGDGQEYFGIDSSVTTDRFHLPNYVRHDPYNPAVPDIAVSVQPEYELIYDISKVEGSETKKDTVSTKVTSNSFDTSATLAGGYEASTTLRASTNPFGNGATVESKAYVNFEASVGYTFHGESSNENSNSNSNYDISEKDLSNTKIRVWLDVENVGTDILASPLSEVMLNFYIGLDKKPFATVPLSVSITNLKPNEKVFLASTDVTLPYQDFKRVEDGAGITVTVAHFSFGEDQRYYENAKATSIKILLDDGSSVKEMYYKPQMGSISIGDLFKKLSYNATFDKKRLLDLNGKKTDLKKKPYKAWDVYITRSFTNTASNFSDNLNETELFPGDVFVLKFDYDSDGDGLSDSTEIRLGTDPHKMDTDGDGLLDGYTLNSTAIGELSVGSNPLVKDTDHDMVSDGLEVKYNTSPTDPNSYPNVVFLFKSKNFEGTPLQVIGEKDLSKTDFNNQVSSILIPKGLAVIAYDDSNFKKGSDLTSQEVFIGPVSDLNTFKFDNKLSSLKVFKIEDLPPVKLAPVSSRTMCLISYKSNLNLFSCSPASLGKILPLSAGIIIPTGGLDETLEFWKLVESDHGMFRIENVGESNKDSKKCISMKDDDISSIDCNADDMTHYVNWIIKNAPHGYFLVNEGSSTSKQPACLGTANSFITHSLARNFGPFKYLCKESNLFSAEWLIIPS